MFKNKVAQEIKEKVDDLYGNQEEQQKYERRVKQLQYKLQVLKRGENFKMCDIDFVQKNILDLDCLEIIREQQAIINRARL